MTTLNGHRYLEIYLNDHRAFAAGGVELARRLCRNLQDTDWAEDGIWLTNQIEEDVETLDHVRTAFRVDGGPLSAVKGMLAVAGERLGRLKLNGHLVTESPLSPVVETEAMIALVQGKRRLWSALRATVAGRPEATGFDFAHLEKRADEQLELLSRIHAGVATQAFPVG